MTAPVSIKDFSLQDKRHRFREVFQAVRAHTECPACDRPVEEALIHLPDELAPTHQAVYLAEPRLALHYVIVTGLAADCLSHQVTPFHRARAYLHERGFTSSVLKVNGRAGSDYNARFIQEALEAFPKTERFVLLGYSKGAVDALHTVVNYPHLVKRIAAIVSLAGAIGGSPLVDTVAPWLQKVFMHLPLLGCHGGDRQSLKSLRREERKRWLLNNPLPPAVLYVSLVTLPKPERISRLLRFNYRKLAYYSVDNDSQVLAKDSVIPQSDLIAYANADHWALTLPLTRQWPLLRWLLDQNEYPREVLLESIVRYVEERLLEREADNTKYALNS